MDVGNTVRYALRVTGDGGEWRGSYTCSVASEVRSKVEAGVFDTYKIKCQPDWNVWIRDYAPRLVTRVRKVHMARSNEDGQLSPDWALVRLDKPTP